MIKLWCLILLLFGLLAGTASSQDSWNLGSSQDWLSVGPIYHTGPYYYNYYYPSYYDYAPVYYLDYYPTYYPTYYSTYYPVYNTYYYPYYPYYYNFDHFPLGTFGVFHGGNY